MTVGLGAAAAAAAVIAVGLAQGWWQGGERLPPPAQPLVATASLSERTLDFGDPVEARLDVLVNAEKADPASVRVRPRFAPHRITASSLQARRADGVLLSYRYALECLTPACVPGRTQVERQFLPVLVTYTTRAGRPRRLAVEWPSYTVASHLTAADRPDPTARMRVDASLPAITYWIDPSTLRTILAALSAALVLAAAALVAMAVRRRTLPGRPALPELPPLRRALRLVRASTSNGYPAERRKALGRLARELRSSDRSDLAHAAVQLAWSSQDPSAEATGAFARQVEAALEEET